MRLEDIGFYTLSDERARNASSKSPMWRCELILTDRCNFNCLYCRGLKPELRGTLNLPEAVRTLDLWAERGLENVRFTGGEPTLYRELPFLVSHSKDLGVKRIAVSTNGSADLRLYQRLVDAGVNDFSVSLDACCSDIGDRMAGGILGAWDRVVENIRELAKMAYVTVGVVLTEDTAATVADVVSFAHGLGVQDIRVISAAQFNRVLDGLKRIPEDILRAHPILRYRVNNFLSGRNVRGLQDGDSQKCSIVLDDCASAGGYHFPCIIYLREGGRPIGRMNGDFREARRVWSETVNPHLDPICKENCLDVCIDYNNRYREFHA